MYNAPSIKHQALGTDASETRTPVKKAVGEVVLEVADAFLHAGVLLPEQKETR